MSVRRILGLAASFLTMTLACSRSQPPSPPVAPKTEELSDYLYDAGNRLNCYFTIESTGSSSAIENAKVSPGEVDSIDALVVKLNNELTGITATRDPVYPVVHLADIKFKVMNHGIMDRKATLNYTGTIGRLVEQLRKKFAVIGPRTWGTLPIPETQDYNTPITVNVQNVSIRQLLTAAVPLLGYSRVLWKAETWTAHNRPAYTSIAFQGKEYQPRLHYYFGEMGKKLGCYFTIERLADAADHESPLSEDKARISLGGNIKTIDDLIDKLNADLKRVTATRSKTDPKVVHLVENELQDRGGHVFERKLTLNYQGTPLGLVKELHAKIPTIGPRLDRRPVGNGGGFGAMDQIKEKTEPKVNPNADPLGDEMTAVKIDVKDMPLREILTSAVPHAGYDRVLWDAETRSKDGENSIEIMFQGPNLEDDYDSYLFEE